MRNFGRETRNFYPVISLEIKLSKNILSNDWAIILHHANALSACGLDLRP